MFPVESEVFQCVLKKRFIYRLYIPLIFHFSFRYTRVISEHSLIQHLPSQICSHGGISTITFASVVDRSGNMSRPSVSSV